MADRRMKLPWAALTALVALGGTALGASPAQAAVNSGAYSLGAGSNPSIVAVDPSVHNVYVSHGADKVTVYDGLSHTSNGTVTVGPYSETSTWIPSNTVHMWWPEGRTGPARAASTARCTSSASTSTGRS